MVEKKNQQIKKHVLWSRKIGEQKRRRNFAFKK